MQTSTLSPAAQGPDMARACICMSNCSFFFFTDTPTAKIYTLSLHDALPISPAPALTAGESSRHTSCGEAGSPVRRGSRSEEHTSELQSRENLVCRLLLE